MSTSTVLLMWVLAVALVHAGVSAPPMPPIEVEKPVVDEAEGVKLETFQFEIDHQRFHCSAAALGTGNRAPYTYAPTDSGFDGELQFHAARCKTRFSL